MNKLQRGVIRFLSAFIFIAAIFMGNHVLADEATLSSVEIVPVQKNFVIILNTDKKVSVNKNIVSENKLLLTLNNAKTSNDIKILYQNAKGIDHVIFYPKDNSVQIEIMGQNINNSLVKYADGTFAKENNNTFSLFLAALGLLGIIAVVKNTKRNKKQFQFSVENMPEDNKILKVVFERKHGLIAQGAGAQKIRQLRPKTSNVQYVNFERDYKEQKLKI